MDKCDRCPAPGMVRLQTRLGSELVLCAHHYADNEMVLVAHNWAIVEDLRHELTATP